MGVIENTPTGRLIFTIMSAFADFERDLIVERTQEGKAIARQKEGFREGRPNKYSKSQMKHALKLLENHSYKQVDYYYDEIFASSPNEIESEALKSLFRQLKYHSIEYDESSRIGFNIQMDALNEKVVETQDLLDIEGLPATGETGDYASSGFTTRNPSWDTYLDLAEKLLEEINADLDAE